jgi:hypothetical protein
LDDTEGFTERENELGSRVGAILISTMVKYEMTWYWIGLAKTATSEDAFRYFALTRKYFVKFPATIPAANFLFSPLKANETLLAGSSARATCTE